MDGLLMVGRRAVVGTGCITWSPLACGILTGKYEDGVPIYSRAALKVHASGEGYVEFYATPNPFPLNKIGLNQGTRIGRGYMFVMYFCHTQSVSFD